MKVISAKTLSEEARHLRLLVFGEPGSGKTWFGASAALDEETSPVLFLEYRAQVTALHSHPGYVKAIEDGRLVILSLNKYEELNYAYTFLFRGPGSVPKLDELFTRHGPPKTVVVDSLTELQRSEVMRRAGNLTDKFITDVEAPQIQHWGQLLNQFTLLAHLYYALPYHVAFVGLEGVDFGRHVVGEAPPIVGYRLALQGQAQRQFPAYALTVMRMERAARNLNAYAIGYTQAARAKTKEQTGRIPARILGPTIPMLARMLREGK